MSNKPTDNEIVKALEYKKEEIICAVADKNKATHFVYNEDALDLINRQKEEIKHLDDENSILSADVDALNGFLEIAKAEAYKEFAEKAIKLIKAKAFNLQLMRSLYTSQSAKALNKVAEDLDNLLKELQGE